MSRIVVKIVGDASELVKLQTEAKRFSSRFQQAFEFTSGAAAFGGLALGVGVLKDGFVDVIKQGVAFNAQMQDAKIGVAAVLRQFNPEKFTSFAGAMNASGEAIDLLKQKALKSPATFQELTGAFQGMSGAAASAGLDMKQQVDLVVLMSQTLAGLGIRSDQILQESRALLTGNINEDAAAARILGITKSQIENAKKEGKLYEFLTGKMKGFSESADASSQTYTVAMSNMKDGTEQLFGELTQPIFETLRQGVLELNKELSSTNFKAALRPLFQDAAAAVKVFMELAQWTAKNAGTISEVARAVMTLGAAYGALRIGQWIVALAREAVALQASTAAIGQEAAAHGTNAAAISSETAAVELNIRARARAMAMPGALGSGGAAAAALMGPGQLALPASNSIAPASGRGNLAPMLMGGGAGSRGVIDIEATVTRVERSGQSAMKSMGGMFTKVGAWAKDAAISAGKLAAADPFAVLAAAMAGWEIGKMLRRPIYGHNGAEDIAKGDDYNNDFNKKLGTLNTQTRDVSSAAEKNALINDLMEARADIEAKLARETAPLLRQELSIQLKQLELMAVAAGRINSKMMEAARLRNQAAAADAKKQRERNENAAGYEEGRKTFGKTDIDTLQGEVDELSKGGTVDEQTQKYLALNQVIDRAKTANQSAVPAEAGLQEAQAALNAARFKLSEEKAKGERITVAQSSMGAGMPGLPQQVTSAPIGDVAGAEAALKAATEERDRLLTIRDGEEAARTEDRKGNEAEAEAIRKTIDKLKEKQKALDELKKARRRSEEGIQIAEAESRGDFAGANEIKRRHAREDLEGQLRGANHPDAAELLERFDQATKADEDRGRARTRGDLEIEEREAGGDYAGAQQLKRQRDLEQYREGLSRQNFDPTDIEEMVSRQAKLQGADQAKALGRYNLDQQALDLRAEGKGEEADKYELAAKRDQMVDENERNFGVDEAVAGAMADKRLGAEIQGQRSFAVSSMQKIGGGGGFSSTSKDPAKLLEEIRGILKGIKDNTKPDGKTTFGSDIAPGLPWL